MSADVRAKLAELGLTLPVAALPIAAYVPAVRTGNIVFTAGQLPLVDGAMAQTGKTGGDVSVERAKNSLRFAHSTHLLPLHSLQI
jgi:enamine deaminase RidA (YjgF/YER057c/UK114 family)